jgi:tetratricopeptide (TPR) repeat protein/CHAT domain-containing protein
MWYLSGWGRLGLILGTFVWVAPVSGWAVVPDEVKVREAEELKVEYGRLYGEGKYGEAAVLAEQACAILGEQHGRESVEIAGCLNDLGVHYWGQGKYEKAEPVMEQALALEENAMGLDHPDIANNLNNLAGLCRAQGNYGKAEPLYERALAIREKALGSLHPSVAQSLNDLAGLYQAQGNYGKAEPLYERALAIREKALGSDHSLVATSLNDLALVYHARGVYGKAAPLFHRALAIWEETLGPEHPNIGTGLYNLALVYHAQGVYGKAAPLFHRALTIWERTLGPEHPLVATSLHGLASLYSAQGKYGKAAPLLKRALTIKEKALGSDHHGIASSLNELALLYHRQGEWGKAEPLFKRALAMCEKALGSDHPNVATSLNNLAMLYGAQGEYGKAEPLYERALAIFEKVYGLDHPDIAANLNNLASLHQAQGEYGKAEPLYERALAIREKVLEPNHPDVATSLSNRAALYVAQGAYGKAEPLYERALAIREKVLDLHHPDVAINLNNLATLHRAQGAYGKAEPLSSQALAIREKSLGPGHPLVAASLNNLAKLHHEQGNHELALKLHRRGLDIEETNLLRILAVADESRRLAYASTLSGSLHYALSLHLRVNPEHDAISELALTTLLRRKNQVQNLVAQSNAALRRSLPDGGRQLLDNLADVESQVAMLSNRGPGKPGVEAFSRQLDKLGRERDRLWSELAKHSAIVEGLDYPFTIGDVQQALPARSVLVEVVQYVPQHEDAGVRVREHEAQPSPRYAAYLVFPDRFDWIDLGPAAPIDEHVKSFRKALQTKQAIPTDLYDAAMRPIVEKLGSAHHLIIAPAGDLSLVPFGALHDGERYLIEKYDLRYVTTGRDLLDPPASPPVTTTPVTIVANPTGAFLPDAETEADFLKGFFPGTRVLRGEQATETNVRTVERPLILHMATHGFFGEARNERNNPLFRSGLYLADIEQVEVDREHDDGQLTAYEVSGMDLRGTQLVVLSACDTGLGAEVVSEGKVLMSEGVSGLRRAFAMAGARTTVMSLWAVSGVTAQKTMEAYYRKLAEGQGPGEAMQAVQLEMLRTKEHAHPKDWAVFIVSGDDTPLSFPAGREPRKAEDEQGPPEPDSKGGCATRPSGRGAPTGSMLIGVLGLTALRRRSR